MTVDPPGHPWPTDPDERLARLVHDLRTPLTIVQGFAELLDRGHTTLDEERRSEYLGRIAQAGRLFGEQIRTVQRRARDDEHADEHHHQGDCRSHVGLEDQQDAEDGGECANGAPQLA